MSKIKHSFEKNKEMNDQNTESAGVDISLYLPANVGEQFQKSGVLGKSFLYLKVC